MIDYVKVNEKLWDEWAKDSCTFSKPISHEDYVKVKNGDWDIYASPMTPIPKEWFGYLKNQNVLCLAGGGGQQSPIFAALGAKVTVFDMSSEQLALDALVAKREGLDITLVKGDMTKALPFKNETFDLIFNPVSTTYIQEVEPLWRECYRILKVGGRLITGIANPDIFAFDLTDGKLELKYQLPYDPISNHHNNYSTTDDIQFSHSIMTQIGGQLKAGFILKDLFEDHHYTSVPKGTKEQMKPAQIAMRLAKYMPIYIITLSIK